MKPPGGVGRALLNELTRRAVAAGREVLDPDSGMQRFDARRFYTRSACTSARVSAR